MVFSHSVVSDSLWPRGLQHIRLPCPSLSPRVCSNSWLSSRWCHPTISSSVVPFSSCPQSLLASGSFPVSQFFTSGGQSIGFSASASVLPKNIQDWFPLGMIGLILQSKGLLRDFSVCRTIYMVLITSQWDWSLQGDCSFFYSFVFLFVLTITHTLFLSNTSENNV